MDSQFASVYKYIYTYIYIYGIYDIHDIYKDVSLAVAQELVRCRLVCLSLVTFGYLSFMQMQVTFRIA